MATLRGSEEPLAAQRALVTGATSGLAAGIARALAKAGASVAVSDVADPKAAEALVAEITARGRSAIGVPFDPGREEEVKAMFAEVLGRLGGLDILVSSTGVPCGGPVQALALEDWERVLRLNLTGPFLCAREASRHFIERGVVPERSRAAGKIICVSAACHRDPCCGHAGYAASKGGVRMLIRTLARGLAPYRVRVNGIAAGAVRTGESQVAWETPRAEAAILERIPYGRLGQPEDVGRAAVWLASDASDYVTGVTLYVDGGMSLQPGHGGEDHG